jgi:hypothetical protein
MGQERNELIKKMKRHTSNKLHTMKEVKDSDSHIDIKKSYEIISLPYKKQSDVITVLHFIFRRLNSYLMENICMKQGKNLNYITCTTNPSHVQNLLCYPKLSLELTPKPYPINRKIEPTPWLQIGIPTLEFYGNDYLDYFIYEAFFVHYYDTNVHAYINNNNFNPHYQGFYVELGGSNGYHASNTYFFNRYLNWTGIV